MSPTVRRLLAAVLVVGFAVTLGCGGKKQQPAAPSCTSNDECDPGLICEADQCVKRPSQELPKRSNMITPDSVKREVERRQRQHEQRVDKSLDL